MVNVNNQVPNDVERGKEMIVKRQSTAGLMKVLTDGILSSVTVGCTAIGA